MEFINTILKLIGDVFRGLFYIVQFIMELFKYTTETISVLPGEVSGTIISVVVVAILLIFYKVVKL